MIFKTFFTMQKVNLYLFVFLFVVLSCQQKKLAFIHNPIYDKYLADPTIVKLNDTFYVYATIDPWGSNELAVLATKDFISWKPEKINWPTKEACTSATSLNEMVWAPSVVKANGAYYMYVTVGGEVWVGTSKHPLGPWKNAKADGSPLIRNGKFPGYHMIDAEPFLDDDGQAYLFWGSGLDWKPGHCFAVKLQKDMISFDGEIKEVTPPNYMEAPFMLKRNGLYYLMYSEGFCIDHTYKVRYSTGPTPFGPWKEGANSPILSTTSDSTTYGPGHHTVFNENGQNYILYHRLKFPLEKNTVLRQLCIDSLNFDESGNIKKIDPKGVTRFIK